MPLKTTHVNNVIKKKKTSSQQLLYSQIAANCKCLLKECMNLCAVRGDSQIVACEKLSLVCFASFPPPYIFITALQEG